VTARRTAVADACGDLAPAMPPPAFEQCATLFLERLLPPDPDVRITSIIDRAQPGPQCLFRDSTADILIIGGGAGGGKSWSLLAEPTKHLNNPDFGAVIFRRTMPQVRNQGGLWDESVKMYPELGLKPLESTARWEAPSGAKIKFAHLQLAKDVLEWKGSQVPLIEFDQLEEFEEGQFWYMFSRNRSTCGVRPYIRGTVNPVPDDDPVGGWLNRLITWWIDQETGYAIPERSGVLRWFVRINDELHWADRPKDLTARFPESEPRSLTFVLAMLKDNPIMTRADPDYKAKLLAMPLVDQERLLGGNWKIKPAAGKVFNRAWFEIVDAAPVDARRVRYWDKAGTSGGGDWSAGVRTSKSPKGIYYIEDVVRGQWASGDRNTVITQTAAADGVGVEIWVEQEPGSGGKESAEISIRELAGYNVRAERVTGSKLTRANPLAAQAKAGNVKLVRGAWNEQFLREAHAFTGKDGELDDQVDAASGGFNKLTLGAGGGGTVRVTGW
jgi:predicted phage terminase large subunit-like protein